MGHLDSMRRVPASLRAAFQSPRPAERTSFPMPFQQLKMTARALCRQHGVTPQGM